MNRTWIDVNEKTPQVPHDEWRSALVLAWADGRVERAYFYKNGEQWFLDNSDFDYEIRPTHWMPMLAAPQEPK